MSRKATPPAEPKQKITPEDIEDRFRSLAGEVDNVTEDARSVALTVGVAVLVGVAVVAFLLGRRKGSKHASVIEIRRV